MKAISKLIFPCLLLISCGWGGKDDSTDTNKPIHNALVRGETRSQIDFSRHVKPILEQRCLRCHDGKNTDTLYALSDGTEAFKKSRIVPGKPSQSLFYVAASEKHPSDSGEPSKGTQLDKGDLLVLKRWILSGAIWPTGEAGQLRKK